MRFRMILCVPIRTVNLLVVATILSFLAFPLRGATLRVPQDHPTIQRAVEAAQEGDVVQVAPGNYEGVVELHDGITLLGSGDATQLSATIKAVSVKRATIASLHVQGADANSHFGIFCLDAEITIEDVNVRDFHHGISAENSQVSIRRCEISHGFNVGIILTQGTEATIQRCTVSESTVGILVSATQRVVEIRESRILKNQLGVVCHSADPLFRDNLITENFIGLTIDQALPDLGTEGDPGRNAIFNNQTLAIRYSGKDWLSAQGNWWGRSSGPTADRIDGRVRFEPWLHTDPRQPFFIQPSAASHPTLWGKLKQTSSGE